MIEKMLKLTMIAKSSDRTALLEELGRLEVVHLVPLETQVTEEAKNLDQRYERLGRALAIVAKVESKSEVCEAENLTAVVDEIITVNEKILALEKESNTLTKQLELQKIWGSVSQQDILGLAKAGLRIRFFKGSSKALTNLKAELVHSCGMLNPKIELVATVAVVTPLPQGVTEVMPPLQDCEALELELRRHQEEIEHLVAKLSQLANFEIYLKQNYEKLATQVNFQKAIDGTFNKEEFFALSGWVPQKRQAQVTALLEKNTCYFTFAEPSDEEEPPTLVTYPKWIQAIAGLFDILNVIPGYRESDISAFFMIFLPIFVAIIIGDAGYGLSMLALGLIFRKKIVASSGKDKANLLLILSVATALYGILFSSYFGNSPSDIAKMGGFNSIAEMQQGSSFLALVGQAMLALGVFWSPDTEDFKITLTVLSFVLGCSHLVLAHLVQFVKYLPSEQALAELGWAIFISGMFGVIWILFLPQIPFIVSLDVILVALGLGALLSICFACPNRKWFKSRIPCGFASCILSWISAFSDMVSYIRLMAVGLSGYYIAMTVNSLAQTAATALADYSVLAVLAFVFIFALGHIFNVILALIAVLAHGVRLNMLEFSNNAGVQWSGVHYSPFALLRSKGE